MDRAGGIDEAATDAGPRRSGRGSSERTCILNRRTTHPDDLIRFVIDPGGRLVADLKAELPGRGAWVTATAAAVSEAIRKRAFSRAFKRDVVVPDDLVARLDRLIEAEAVAALSLANKAGAVVTGTHKVEEAIAAGRIGVLIHASDAAPDGVRKLGDALRRHAGDGPLPYRVTFLSGPQLDLALGRSNVVHGAISAGCPADYFLARCKALEVFRTGSAAVPVPEPSANEPKH